jgi:hypothetical protein
MESGRTLAPALKTGAYYHPKKAPENRAREPHSKLGENHIWRK